MAIKIPRFNPSSIAKRYRDNSIQAYKPDPTYTRMLMARSSTPIFSVAAPSIMATEPKPISLLPYLVLAMREFTKDPNWQLFPQYQAEGTCVGQSHKLLGDIALSISRYVSGLKFPGRTTVCANYAGGRVDIAKQPGVWQGSNGSWSAEFLKNFGMLLGEAVPELAPYVNAGTQAEFKKFLSLDENLAMSWTRSREGVPKQYEDAARVRPFEGYAMANTVDEVVHALSNCKLVNICHTSLASKQRDNQGISRMQSIRGGHSTMISGWNYINGSSGKRCFERPNSWWWYYSGPSRLSDNLLLENMQRGVTHITEDDLQSVLRSRDCFIFWGPEGLEPISEKYKL